MPLFYVKIRKNIDICNYLPIYYPAICRGWGTFSVPSLKGDKVTVITSQNLTRGNRNESYIVTTMPDVFDKFLKEIKHLIENNAVPLSDILQQKLQQ